MSNVDVASIPTLDEVWKSNPVLSEGSREQVLGAMLIAVMSNLKREEQVDKALAAIDAVMVEVIDRVDYLRSIVVSKLEIDPETFASDFDAFVKERDAATAIPESDDELLAVLDELLGENPDLGSLLASLTKE